MIGQSLSNINEKCHSIFFLKKLPTKHGLGRLCENAECRRAILDIPSSDVIAQDNSATRDLMISRRYTSIATIFVLRSIPLISMPGDIVIVIGLG
jgi:hypothetical protein